MRKLSLIFANLIHAFLLIIKTTIWNYVVIIFTHLKWAFDYMLYHSNFSVRASDLNIQELIKSSEEQLMRITRSECEENEEECAVCLCKIEEQEEMGELRCGHAFHRVCLERWIGFKKTSCPLCRASLVPPFVEAVELGDDQVLVFKFFSFTRQENRDNWWLR